jgi:[ribosomal protein S5]-alanine N-acetyltransferase
MDRTSGCLPTLTGDGVLLRALGPEDASAVLEIFGDPEVVRWMAIARLRDEGEARAFIEDVDRLAEAGTLFQWGIGEGGESGGEVVGTATLAHVDLRHRRAEVGFAVVPRLWGRRIVSRALPVLVTHAFETLGLHRLEADVDPENTASLRVLETNGFRREGHLRERYTQDGRWHDAVLLGLLRREWRATPDRAPGGAAFPFGSERR